MEWSGLLRFTLLNSLVGGLLACSGEGVNVQPRKTDSGATPTVITAGGRLFAPVQLASADPTGTSGSSPFNLPSGLEIDPRGRIFIAEAGSHRIRVIEPDGRMMTFAGSAAGLIDGPALEAQFREPLGVALTRDGAVIVADTGNHCIRKISPDGQVDTLAGNGEAGLNDGAGGAARFRSPFAVAVTALDEIVVADTGNHRIRLVDRNGNVSTMAGGQAGYVDGSAEAARFNAPADVAVDEFGRIVVTDFGNNAIRRIDFLGGQVATVAGSAIAGSSDGGGNASRFRSPAGLAIDRLGHIYVADSGNSAIRRIGINGETTTVARVPAVVLTDVAVTPDGALFITDAAGHRVLRSP